MGIGCSCCLKENQPNSNENNNNNSQSRRLPVIRLRQDQLIRDQQNTRYHDQNVRVFAPGWIRQGLDVLSRHIRPGTWFRLVDSRGGETTLTISPNGLSLTDLVAIARNESANNTGEIDFASYQPIVNSPGVIYSIKDLARQCIVVGFDETTHYGGFKSRRIPQQDTIMIIDLVALQFNQSYNTGRLVLVGEDLPTGILDDLIFINVVGEPKKSFAEASEDKSGRFVRYGSVFFDSLAYKKFVAADVLLSIMAVNQTVNFVNLINPQAVDGVNFKFLKYGTDYFDCQYDDAINKHIAEGIALGLTRFFGIIRGDFNQRNWIQSFEFPYFEFNGPIFDVCVLNDINCRFSRDDPLLKTNKKLTTATTNSGDPHVITGNQMQFRSIDEAIAENLKSRGCTFSPVINRVMGQQFIHWQELGVDESELLQSFASVSSDDPCFTGPVSLAWVRKWIGAEEKAKVD